MNSIFNRGHVGTGGREIFDGREWDVVNFYPGDFRVVPEAGKINLKPARGDVNDNAEWEFVLVEPERCYSDRSRCMVACRKSSSELGRGGELRGHRQDFAVSGSGPRKNRCSRHARYATIGGNGIYSAIFQRRPLI